MINKLLVIMSLMLPALRVVAQDGDLMREIERLSAVGTKELFEDASRHIMNNDMDSTFICYSVISERRGQRNESDEDARVRASALGGLGYLYMNYYLDPFKAYNLLLEARDLAIERGFNDLLGFIYINIAYVNYYDNLLSGEMPDDFILHSQQAFDMQYEYGNKSNLVIAIMNLIELSIEQRDISLLGDRVKKFRSVEISDSIILHDYIMKACDGIEAYARGDLAVAAACFIEASEHVRVDVNPEQSIITALTCAADIYTEAGRYDDAEAVLLRAISMVKDRETRVHALTLYSRMSHLCELMGDSAKIHDYTYHYLSLKDTLINRSQIGGSQEAQFLYNFNRANEQVKTMTLRHRNQKVLLIAVCIVVVVVSVLLFFVLRLYRRNNESYHTIYSLYQELLKREKQHKAGEAVQTSHALPSRKHKSNSLSDEDAKALLSRIINVMETSAEIYDVDFGIERLAELVEVKQWRYVSEVINRETGSNFFALLNKYRITEACRMMDDTDESDKYTIEYISSRVGFKSRSAFSVVFKSITGLTPSVYRSTAKARKN